jgi:hypothetical protein
MVSEAWCTSDRGRLCMRIELVHVWTMRIEQSGTFRESGCHRTWRLSIKSGEMRIACRCSGQYCDCDGD